jgi:hypothetical protein
MIDLNPNKELQRIEFTNLNIISMLKNQTILFNDLESVLIDTLKINVEEGFNFEDSSLLKFQNV